MSLRGIADGYFDLVFSFDALVHVEKDVIQSYIPQILGKLTLNGVAFLHHSNLAALPPEAGNVGARGHSVSADIVADIVKQAGGKVLVKERINWGAPHLGLLDCLTLLARQGYPSTAPTIEIDNMRFMVEAQIIRETQAAYCT